MTEQIKTAIQEKIGKVLEVSPEGITEHLELSHLGLNSIKTVVLVVELEEQFDITFADYELLYEYFSTLHKIVSLVSEKLAAQ